MRVFPISGVAATFETLSSLTTAKGFTSTKISPTSGNFSGCKARAAIISVETGGIRFTIDGTTPTTTVGHILPAGASYEIDGELNIANFKCINSEAGNGAVVQCTFLF